MSAQINTRANDTKHTAGPYTFTGPDEFGDFNIVKQNSAGDIRAIAAVVSNLRDPNEVLANARLLASAFCMLKALKGVLPLLEHLETQTLVGHEGCLWSVEAVRDAIDQAEGPEYQCPSCLHTTCGGECAA